MKQLKLSEGVKMRQVHDALIAQLIDLFKDSDPQIGKAYVDLKAFLDDDANDFRFAAMSQLISNICAIDEQFYASFVRSFRLRIAMEIRGAGVLDIRDAVEATKLELMPPKGSIN